MIIDLDIDEIIDEFNLPINLADRIVEDSVDKVSIELYRNWQLQATDNLNSTRNEYINNLQMIYNSPYSRTILLTGKLPNIIEKGASAFDLKSGFARSKKVKYSVKTDSNGNVTMHWFLTIPFRIGTPGIVGENSAFSSVMPQSVYDVIKNKEANRGLKKSEIPSPHDIPGSRKEIVLPNRVIPEYQHKSSIYEGMQKKSSAYGKVIQNTYINFRRVSENSDPNSWIHKGIQAYDLMGKTIKETDVVNIVENNIDKILEENGYGQ